MNDDEEDFTLDDLQKGVSAQVGFIYDATAHMVQRSRKQIDKIGSVADDLEDIVEDIRDMADTYHKIVRRIATIGANIIEFERLPQEEVIEADEDSEVEDE